VQFLKVSEDSESTDSQDSLQFISDEISRFARMFDPYLLIIFAGVIISLLGFVGAILDELSIWEKVRISLLFLFIGMVQFSYYIWFLGMDHLFLLVHSTHLPFACCISPLLYIFLQIIIRTNKVVSKRYILHFIPAIFVLFVIVPYIFVPDAEKLLIVNELNRGQTTLTYSFLIGLIRYFIFTQIICYLLHFVIKTRTLVNFKSFRREEVTFHIFAIIVLCIITLIVGLCGMIFFDNRYYLLSHKSISFSITLLLLYLHLLVRKHPDSTLQVQKEFENVKYENSNLKNVNLDKIREQLDKLLELDKIYKDHDISMDKLSSMLGIGGHKLSQYLNEILKTNFYDFINRYRIVESEKILLGDPNRTVLSIALEVGFSSQSTFYSAFRKKWKMSPNIFRKKFLKK
jgi:AraC-like DNA-binding protein